MYYRISHQLLSNLMRKREVNKMIKGLDRINELAKKQREEGLTNAEKVEQTSLTRRLLT